MPIKFSDPSSLFNHTETVTGFNLISLAISALDISFLVGFSAAWPHWGVPLPQDPVFLRLFLIGGFQTFMSSPEFYCPYNTWYPRPGL